MTDFEQLQTELLALPQVNGIVPVDILSLPQAMSGVIRGLVRDKTITSVELAAAVGISHEQAKTAAGILVDKGYMLIVDEKSGGKQTIETRDDSDRPEEADRVESNDVTTYRIHFARIHKHRIPIDL